MHKSVRLGALLLGAVVVSGPVAAQQAQADGNMVAEGKKIALDRRKGNCAACHMMDNVESPGTFGPPLMMMKQRFPDKAKLRAQLWDPQVANPNTSMPPFGKHEILSSEELDKVVEYVWSL